MIWGKKDTKSYAGKTTKIRTGEKPNWFALFPVHLRDGRWCWMQKVHRYFDTWWFGGGYI